METTSKEVVSILTSEEPSGCWLCPHCETECRMVEKSCPVCGIKYQSAFNIENAKNIIKRQTENDRNAEIAQKKSNESIKGSKRSSGTYDSSSLTRDGKMPSKHTEPEKPHDYGILISLIFVLIIVLIVLFLMFFNN